MMSGRFAGVRELGNPLLMTAREMVDWVYFVFTEHMDNKAKSRFDDMLDVSGRRIEDDQDERRARIAAMGGGVG